MRKFKKQDTYKRILYTRDGRKTGNAICRSFNWERPIVCVTDYGNIMRLTYQELTELFIIGDVAPDDHKHKYSSLTKPDNNEQLFFHVRNISQAN